MVYGTKIILSVSLIFLASEKIAIFSESSYFDTSLSLSIASFLSRSELTFLYLVSFGPHTAPILPPNYLARSREAAKKKVFILY